MILNFTACLNNRRGAPIISESISIANLGNTTLAAFIRGEIVNYHPSTTYADSDLKSIKSSSGRNHTRNLNLPMSIFIESIQNESPKYLSVVIDRSVQQFLAEPIRPTMFSRLMAASVPSTKKYESKWSLSDVIEFQAGFEAAVSKEDYLKSFSKEEKPNIYEQLDAIAADFLSLYVCLST